MIARLKGLVDSVSADSVIVDVNGVGYLVQASTRTLASLSVGQPVVLHIETQVREDAIQLFGFLTEAERDSFRLLTTVQGVGARVALSILSTLSPDEIWAGTPDQFGTCSRHRACRTRKRRCRGFVRPGHAHRSHPGHPSGRACEGR